MPTAFITVTHRTVEHADPESAGFIDGHWWTLTDPYGYVESASPTAEASEAHARSAAEVRARGNGYVLDSTSVVRDDKLLNRTSDEARVRALIAANSAA